MSTTAPKPPRSCSVTGCREPCDRFNCWAPVLAYGHWRDRPFCPEHQPQAEKEALRIKLEALRKPYPRMRDWTFDTFPADDPAGASARTAARRWLMDEEADTSWSDGNLLIFGPVGSGKTGLAWSCAVAILEDNPWEHVRFCNVRQMLADVRRSFASDEPIDPTEDLIDAGLLVLDDVGAERPTEWALETLATIIEGRYVSGYRPTLVTSNYSPSELAQRLGHDDSVIGLRIVSRLTDGAAQIRLDRPDLRTREMAQRRIA